MKQTWILGIGSTHIKRPLAWQAIDIIRSAPLPLDVQTAKLDRPGISLVDYFDRANRLIIIDSMLTPGCPGCVVFPNPNNLGHLEELLTADAIGVTEALQLANMMGKLPSQLLVIGLGVDPDYPAATANQDALRFCANKVASYIDTHFE